MLILSIPVSLYALTQERELFYQAETQYFAKNYVVALETYREFVKRYPLSDLIPDAQYHRAVCLYHIKRYDESLRLFDLIEKKYRSTRFIDYVPFWKGVIFFDTGRFQLSRENLEIFLSRVEKEGKIEKGRPFVPEALMYLTRSNIETGNYREARDSMAKLVEVKGYKGLTQYETVVYSHILFKLRDFKEFGRLCRTVDLEDYPPDYRNFIILPWAEMYWETGKLDEAKKLYEMLLDASDEIASIAYQRLYSIAQRSQDFSTMEAVGRQAELKLQDYPGVIGKLWVGLGIENYRRGDYPKAEFFLQKAWEKRSDPGTHTGEEVPVYLSEIFLKNEKPDEARKILEEYLKTSEKQAGVLYFRLGTLYLRNREYERASEAFANYIKRKPGGVLIPGALYLAAYCEYRTKRFNSALQYCDSFLNSIKLEESVEDIAEGIIDERVVEDVVRLKARSLIELNRLDEAELFLGLYCNKNPGSEEVRFELLKLLFKRSKYDAVVRESSSMKDDFPGLKESHPFDYLIVQYLKGLSHIALKQYGDAAKSLGEISADDVRRSEAGFILPFWMYYRAYALYRNDRVRDSRKIALEFVASYQNHELYDEALDLGGWCSYSLGDFKKAEELFTLLLEKGDKKYSERALFFKGKSLKSMGRLEEAKKCFTGIYLDRSPSDGDYGYADDALFEHAEIQLAEGEVQKAADMYLELSRRYAKSPLAEEALYKRGEVYLSKGMYAEAKGAFRHYRQSSEEGRLADASIYWEGFATEKLGEKRGALILWEDIIRSYPKSTFRPDALRAAAETYASSEDYRRALDLYTTLINEYPEYAKGINASLRLEEIRYILFGMSKREAELTALMSKSGGVRTKEGRNAMIELSRQYIQENQKIERAYQMLSQVIQQDDPETAARAGVLLGEYYFKIGDFERAGREFFQASLRNPGDRDLVAYALYHSAEMMKLAGRDKEMNELLERLNERFPGSEWSDAGKKLKETSKTAPEKNR
ncbi:MAG: tetratricopeptide repeat protein [Spirochaetota bacterium]